MTRNPLVTARLVPAGTPTRPAGTARCWRATRASGPAKRLDHLVHQRVCGPLASKLSQPGRGRFERAGRAAARYVGCSMPAPCISPVLARFWPMQGPVVMPVVILLALFILVAVPFAGTRGSGHSLSGGRHSHRPESQDQIPGHSVAPGSFGGDATDPGPRPAGATAHVHVPTADAVLSEAPPARKTPLKVTTQPTGGKSSMS